MAERSRALGAVFWAVMAAAILHVLQRGAEHTIIIVLRSSASTRSFCGSHREVWVALNTSLFVFALLAEVQALPTFLHFIIVEEAVSTEVAIIGGLVIGACKTLAHTV